VRREKKEVSEPVLGTSEGSIALQDFSSVNGLALACFAAGVSPRLRERKLTNPSTPFPKDHATV
jgi:hypothetical protein